MGLSQREIAERAGLPQSRICRIEAGAYERDIGLRVISPLSKGYGIPLIELLAIFYPELSGLGDGDGVLNIKIEPNRSLERSVVDLRAAVVASGSKLESTFLQALEGLQTNQDLRAAVVASSSKLESTFLQALESLQANQEEALAEIRNALAVVMATATDFNAAREELVSMSRGHRRHPPTPQPIEGDEDLVG